MRPDGRRTDELRAITITPDFNRYAEGSALIAFGETHVICTASVEEKVPGFLEGKGKGWVTAEYAMLPRATHTRSGRAGGGRGQEIQRLIGRSLRAAIDPRALGPRQITIDCDVIQADGGTRTAAITGGYVALALAVRRLQKAGKIGREVGRESGKESTKNPIRQPVAAISAGIIDGEARIDLPYVEDSEAEVDCNFVMTGDGRFVEIQATAEKGAFSAEQYGSLVALAAEAMKTLFARQREAIERARP